MSNSAHGKPILIRKDDKIGLINEISDFSEAYIQDLIFDYPECLPVSDIDEAYNPLIPVCKELQTPVGPLDILFITPKGEITIVETKLWRNPEARRKVVAQILDYARELSKWTYEDLQRELNRKLDSKGNILYRIASQNQGEELIKESHFVDTVNRNLRRGKFLLLIAGDGIKEGTIGITEFLSHSGSLNFSFGMIELSIYESIDLGRLVVPKTIVKTTEISRYTIEAPDGFKIIEDNSIESSSEDINPEWEEEKNFYFDFWSELVDELQLDDPGQPLTNPMYRHNYYLHPSSSKKIWISTFFAKSQNRVGVFLGYTSKQGGKEIFDEVTSDEEELNTQMTEDMPKNHLYRDPSLAELPCSDIFDPKNRKKLKEFFKFWLNRFVNVYRPRLKELGY